MAFVFPETYAFLFLLSMLWNIWISQSLHTKQLVEFYAVVGFTYICIYNLCVM